MLDFNVVDSHCKPQQTTYFKVVSSIKLSVSDGTLRMFYSSKDYQQIDYCCSNFKCNYSVGGNQKLPDLSTSARTVAVNCSWPDYHNYFVAEMAPAYKLTYFQLTALGEPIRFLMHYGDIDFEDHRIELAEWPEYKSSSPFGQLPFLEHNGKKVNQSIAICRYLAKQMKLAGVDDWEDLEIDAIVDTVYDLRFNLGEYFRESNDEVRAKMKLRLMNETVPFYLERLDNIAKENNGHLALGRLTWADVFFVAILNYLSFMAEVDDIIEKYPNLKTVENNVVNLPKIKAWIETRPKSLF